MRSLSIIAVLLAGMGLLSAATTPQSSPLTATPNSLSITYTKSSGTQIGATDVRLVAPASFTKDVAFTIKPTSVPMWLTPSAMSGTVTPSTDPGAGTIINLTPNSVAAALGVGTYTASIAVQVTGYPDLQIPVVLVVGNDAPSLSLVATVPVAGTVTMTPGIRSTGSFTVKSNNEPIAFTVDAAVTDPASPTDWLKPGGKGGVAYSWGTVISFSVPDAILSANVGGTMTGTLTVTPAGAGTPIVVNVIITVTPPAPTIAYAWPAELPVPSSNAGQTRVVLSGTNFINTGNLQSTVTVDPKNSAACVANNVIPEIISDTTMMVSIDNKDACVGSADTLTITVSNGNGTQDATSTINLTTNPIVYAVANSASFAGTAPGATPSVAPYELISIFVDNLGLALNETSLVPKVNASNNYRYPAVLTSTNAGDIIVRFYKSDGKTLVADAPLVFVTGSQINAVVPAAVSTAGASVKVGLVTNAETATPTVGTPIKANVVTADPGIYTLASSGQGPGAILNAVDFSVNSASNPVAKGSAISIYATGLGTPASTATNTAQTLAYPGSCLSPAAYISTINLDFTAGWKNMDGAVILSSELKAGVLPPCFTTVNPVTVKIDGKNATVTYAGFVADSIGGLYQINATVPTGVGSGAVPLTVSIGKTNVLSSQSGVTVAVQ